MDANWPPDEFRDHRDESERYNRLGEHYDCAGEGDFSGPLQINVEMNRGWSFAERALDRLSASRAGCRRVRVWSLVIAVFGVLSILMSAYRLGAGDGWGAVREASGAGSLLVIASLGILLYHAAARLYDEAAAELMESDGASDRAAGSPDVTVAIAKTRRSSRSND